MNKDRLHLLIRCSMLIAVVFLATTLIRIPLVNGYVNLGDSFILLSSIILGSSPVVFISAGLGAALSDLIAYPHYMIATFIIKVIVAFSVWFISVKLMKTSKWGLYIGFAVAELLMVLGYFVFEAFVYGLGISVVNIPWNLLQGFVCAVVAIILMKITDGFKNFKGR